MTEYETTVLSFLQSIDMKLSELQALFLVGFVFIAIALLGFVLWYSIKKFMI